MVFSNPHRMSPSRAISPGIPLFQSNVITNERKIDRNSLDLAVDHSPHPNDNQLHNDSISITFGRDKSTIILPREHAIAKHLEHFLPGRSISQNPLFPRRQLQEKRPRELFSILSQGEVTPPPTQKLEEHSTSPPSLSTRTPGSKRRQSSWNKRCQFQSCLKISVSRGLCRRHGGGRRCQVAGCTKSAQSRSDFCWAHGGGQRCEARNCMRSRKSKHFCSTHIDMEVNAGSARKPKREHVREMDPLRSNLDKWHPASNVTKSPRKALPSLHEALSMHQGVRT